MRSTFTFGSRGSGWWKTPGWTSTSGGHESYGTVAVFEDLYGNRWGLILPG